MLEVHETIRPDGSYGWYVIVELPGGRKVQSSLWRCPIEPLIVDEETGLVREGTPAVLEALWREHVFEMTEMKLWAKYEKEKVQRQLYELETKRVRELEQRQQVRAMVDDYLKEKQEGGELEHLESIREYFEYASPSFREALRRKAMKAAQVQ